MRSLLSRTTTVVGWRFCVTSGLAASLVLAAGAVAPAWAQAAATPPRPQTVSGQALMATVRTLASDEYAGRAAGTPGGLKARGWIRDRFQAIGLQTVGDAFERPFSFTPPGRATNGGAMPAVDGANLVGRCAGAEPARPLMVVSAHYDHVGVRRGTVFPGADDNASGVAVLLELAAACLAQPFRHDLLFVAFDAEESDLKGAKAFVANPPVPKDRISLNVNLDMLARGDKGELYASGLRHSPALRPLLEPVAARAPIALRFGHDTPGAGHDDWTLQSDHGAFHEAGIPFVYFGVEDHPDYHQPTDTAEKIDPDFFAKAASVVLDALRALDQGLP